MRHIDRREGVWILAFFGIAAVLFASFYLFAERIAHEQSMFKRIARSERKTGPDVPSGWIDGKRLLLPLDQTVAVGDARLVYRGIAGRGRVQIDVIIPAFDPNASYRYYLDKNAAEKGFFLIRQHFRLKGANSAEARLEKQPP